MERHSILLLLILTALWKALASDSVLECAEGKCHGSWRKPNGCTYDCKYAAEWCVGSEDATFIVNSTDDDGWIGIGFSMSNFSDIVVAGVTRDNATFIEDRWLMGTDISQDASQDIINASVDRSHGITMIFTRRRNTGDYNHDIKLNCQSIFFAWGKKATALKLNKIRLHKPRFEDISENDTCFCQTVKVTPMPSFNLTLTIPTTDLCPSCRMVLNICNMNPTCKQIYDDRQEHCKNILEWDDFNNETEPVCTNKCKENLVALEQFFGKALTCCNCGEISDDHKLSDVSATIRCRQIHENIVTWCPDAVNTMHTTCPECKIESHTAKRCLDMLNICMKDESCNQLMEDMERKCNNVHAWNEYSMNKPTCSENCFQAIFQLVLNPIGLKLLECDCRVPQTQAAHSSLSKNSAFEEQCFQHQRNRHTFCYHKYSCKGQQFSCKWLIDACTNDPTCKQLHDDWKEECNALINWTIHSKGPPICTDECKKANDDFKKHKIWRRSIDCNCGNINDNVELKEIRETEKCLRQRFTLSAFCDKGIFIECPKDPCEPEMCIDAHKKCNKSDSCKRLYEDWEKKCMDVWESTTEMCSNECKNATVELYNDLYGQHLRGCDCGARPLYISPPPEQVKCFERKIKMEEVCKMNDTKQCQSCKAKKACSYSCDKVRSVCTNDTDCNMIWNKYKTYCNGVILWDHNTTMPTCTDQCKKWIEELVNNPIGKYIKCCSCDQKNEVEKMHCITERQNIAIVCDLDYNHVNDCHNNQELCTNDMLIKDYGDAQDTNRHDSTDNPLTCYGWREKCLDDKCCRKAYHDVSYNCYDVLRNNTPVCSDRCANALGVLYNDYIGKNMRCCNCGRFSEINRNNLTALKLLVRCNNSRNNLDSICKTLHTPGCNHKQLLHTFQDPCTISSCQDALSSCKSNNTCKMLFDNYANQCNRVLQPNSINPVCSDGCKEAINKLYTDYNGFKLKCCDCGSLNQQRHLTTVHNTLALQQCFVERSRLIDYCAVNHDDCINCKHKVCPNSCEEAIKQCINNINCNISYNLFNEECKNVLSWDGNSGRPRCTDECKAIAKVFHKRLDCCACGDKCILRKRNIEVLCNTILNSHECQIKKKTCEDNKAIFDHRDQCPPRMCIDWNQRCKNDKLCTRFYNDVQLYCHNVLKWQSDDQVEPTCTPICQKAIDKLALVTNLTMGYNIICCTCGNYSDLRSNYFIDIRNWEKCRRETRNIKQFCRHSCTDCNKPLPMRQLASCKLVTRMCNEIKECKAMKDKINGLCSNVFTWEKNTSERPQCNSECKQAWMALQNSSYGTLQCCDCHHDDMTAGEKRKCKQQQRNVEELCNLRMEGMCNNTCNNDDQQNKSKLTEDCFDHAARCNRDVECSDYLFNYTNQCGMAFSGDQMTPDQDISCKEAANKLFTYEQLGENFTNCECNAHPELCTELFKNRFLLDKSCKQASDRCKTNAACDKLLSDHTSCTVTNSSCSQTCMIKAVLLYRHYFGKAWWRACKPHYFEQVCFKLY